MGCKIFRLTLLAKVYACLHRRVKRITSVPAVTSTARQCKDNGVKSKAVVVGGTLRLP